MTDQHRPAPLRVAFHTLGCRLNQYDTEGVKAALQRVRPIEVVPWDQAADLYFLNSCTVTGKADQECRRLARQVKRRRPQACVVVAGCYAQTQPQDLVAVPEIDGVLGNTTKDQVQRWLPGVLRHLDRARLAGGPTPADPAATAAEAGGAPLVLVEEFGRRPQFDGPQIADFAGRSRAFVKIQDGCDLRCTYCLIWRARGPGRSRPRDAVLAQLARLHEDAGYNELVLTGVHMGSWGRDLEGRPMLADLLAAVCDRFPALRVRLSSIHPDELTPPLLTLLRERPQLRPHLHVSLQSGSDSVLGRMRRPYRSQQARDAVAAAVAVDPLCGLGADVIVGFPGETDAEFAATRNLVAELPFSYLHVFRYSPRPGTPAAAMPAVHPETVSERAAELRAMARGRREAFAAALVGHEREAVIEDPDPRRPAERHATTDNYASVTVASPHPAGTLVRLALTGQQDGRLRGEVTRVLREARP